MDEYKQLLEDSKNYLQTRYDLFRLELLDKLSRIVGILLLVIVSLFLAMGAVAYFSVALVNALSNLMPVGVACVILGVLLLVILWVLYLHREHIFINPFVRMLSSVLFEQPLEEKEDKDERDV